MDQAKVSHWDYSLPKFKFVQMSQNAKLNIDSGNAERPHKRDHSSKLSATQRDSNTFPAAKRKRIQSSDVDHTKRGGERKKSFKDDMVNWAKSNFNASSFKPLLVNIDPDFKFKVHSPESRPVSPEPEIQFGLVRPTPTKHDGKYYEAVRDRIMKTSVATASHHHEHRSLGGKHILSGLGRTPSSRPADVTSMELTKQHGLKKHPAKSGRSKMIERYQLGRKIVANSLKKRTPSPTRNILSEVSKVIDGLDASLLPQSYLTFVAEGIEQFKGSEQPCDQLIPQALEKLSRSQILTQAVETSAHQDKQKPEVTKRKSSVSPVRSKRGASVTRAAETRDTNMNKGQIVSEKSSHVPKKVLFKKEKAIEQKNEAPRLKNTTTTKETDNSGKESRKQSPMRNSGGPSEQKNVKEKGAAKDEKRQVEEASVTKNSDHKPIKFMNPVNSEWKTHKLLKDLDELTSKKKLQFRRLQSAPNRMPVLNKKVGRAEVKSGPPPGKAKEKEPKKKAGAGKIITEKEQGKKEITKKKDHENKSTKPGKESKSQVVELKGEVKRPATAVSSKNINKARDAATRVYMLEDPSRRCISPLNQGQGKWKKRKDSQEKSPSEGANLTTSVTQNDPQTGSQENKADKTIKDPTESAVMAEASTAEAIKQLDMTKKASVKSTNSKLQKTTAVPGTKQARSTSPTRSPTRSPVRSPVRTTTNEPSSVKPKDTSENKQHPPVVSQTEPEAVRRTSTELGKTDSIMPARQAKAAPPPQPRLQSPQSHMKTANQPLPPPPAQPLVLPVEKCTQPTATAKPKNTPEQTNTAADGHEPSVAKTTSPVLQQQKPTTVSEPTKATQQKDKVTPTAEITSQTSNEPDKAPPAKEDTPQMPTEVYKKPLTVEVATQVSAESARRMAQQQPLLETKPQKSAESIKKLEEPPCSTVVKPLKSLESIKLSDKKSNEVQGKLEATPEPMKRAADPGSVPNKSKALPEPSKVTPEPGKVTPEPDKAASEPGKATTEPSKASPATLESPEPANDDLKFPTVITVQHAKLADWNKLQARVGEVLKAEPAGVSGHSGSESTANKAFDVKPRSPTHEDLAVLSTTEILKPVPTVDVLDKILTAELGFTKVTQRVSELRDMVNAAVREHRIFCIYDNHRYIARPVRQELLLRGWLEMIPDRRMIPRRRPPRPGPVAHFAKTDVEPNNIDALLKVKDDLDDLQKCNVTVMKDFTLMERRRVTPVRSNEDNAHDILSEFCIIPPNMIDRKRTNTEIREFVVKCQEKRDGDVRAKIWKPVTPKTLPMIVDGESIKPCSPGAAQPAQTDAADKPKEAPASDVSYSSHILTEGEARAISKIMQTSNCRINFMWLSIKPGMHLKCYNYTPELINKFQKTTFCTKIGLWHHLNNLQWFSNEVKFPAKSPRMYNTGETDDLEAFYRDYQITACMGMLKWLADTFFDRGIKAVQSKRGKVPLRAFEFAIKQCEKFAKHKENEDLSHADEVSTLQEEWNTFLQWYFTITNDRGKIVEGSNAQLVVTYTKAVETLRLMKKYWPEMDIDGKLNMWIMKPYCASCGRGIFMTNNVFYISQHTKYIVQKYIEKPFLIYNTKFDIRQWFMITKLLPLEVWMYKECYLRFCTQPFALRNLHESVHLSNNSVQRKYVSPKDTTLPDQNMWDSETFQQYLKQVGQPHVWTDVIYPGMRDAVVSTMLAAQDTFDPPRKCWFEVYGADFMLSHNLKEGPWLIEINENPAMDPSTKVTARLCPQMLRDVVKVVVDKRLNKKAPTGQWELVYRQNYTPSYGTVDLDVKGKRIFKSTVPAKPVALDLTPLQPQVKHLEDPKIKSFWEHDTKKQYEVVRNMRERSEGGAKVWKTANRPFLPERSSTPPPRPTREERYHLYNLQNRAQLHQPKRDVGYTGAMKVEDMLRKNASGFQARLNSDRPIYGHTLTTGIDRYPIRPGLDYNRQQYPYTTGPEMARRAPKSALDYQLLQF